MIFSHTAKRSRGRKNTKKRGRISKYATCPDYAKKKSRLNEVEETARKNVNHPTETERHKTAPSGCDSL